jgi:hypothetical protein
MRKWSKKKRPLLVGVKYGTHQIAVWCPYCRRYHFHGWDHDNRKDREVSHRCAHCSEPVYDPKTESPFRKGGYWIALAPSIST